MYNLTIFLKLIFGVTIAWIENDCHLEFQMADNRPQTRMCHIQFLGFKSSRIHNLKPNFVEVDVRIGQNAVTEVNTFFYILNHSITFESYDVMMSIIARGRIRFYPLNHKSIGHQTQPTNKYSNHGCFFSEIFLMVWRTGF